MRISRRSNGHLVCPVLLYSGRLINEKCFSLVALQKIPIVAGGFDRRGSILARWAWATQVVTIGKTKILYNHKAVTEQPGFPSTVSNHTISTQEGMLEPSPQLCLTSSVIYSFNPVGGYYANCDKMDDLPWRPKRSQIYPKLTFPSPPLPRCPLNTHFLPAQWAAGQRQVTGL